MVKKEKKYQYTKPYKERDRTKDFGRGKPLKISTRLKYPQKPQYYTLHTVKKLTKQNPYFNIFNRDPEKNRQQYFKRKQIQEQAQKGDANTLAGMQQEIGRSAGGRPSNQTRTPSQTNTNTQTSYGITSISNKSASSPFNVGYCVTSGPKVQKSGSSMVMNSGIAQTNSYQNTPQNSVIGASSKSINSAISLVLLASLINKSQNSQRPSI